MDGRPLAESACTSTMLSVSRLAVADVCRSTGPRPRCHDNQLGACGWFRTRRHEPGTRPRHLISCSSRYGCRRRRVFTSWSRWTDRCGKWSSSAATFSRTMSSRRSEADVVEERHVVVVARSSSLQECSRDGVEARAGDSKAARCGDVSSATCDYGGDRGESCLCCDSIMVDEQSIAISEDLDTLDEDSLETARLPPRLPGNVTPNFHMREPCRTMPLIGGFFRGSPVSPPLHSGAATGSPSFTNVGSQDLDVTSRPILFTHSTISYLLGQSGSLRAKEMLNNRRRNARAGEMGDPRENPPTGFIGRHDSHLRKSECDSAGDCTRVALVGGDCEVLACEGEERRRWRNARAGRRGVPEKTREQRPPRVNKAVQCGRPIGGSWIPPPSLSNPHTPPNGLCVVRPGAWTPITHRVFVKTNCTPTRTQIIEQGGGRRVAVVSWTPDPC
ncbi:hypothetical protein PR048_016057 [Dryococelus australis]|uniref:Uncharacterized protein n=1 Tax=Dryococelus australis TaxID=614101 RepID=A0ABQ9HJ27_9NEOP|nr:hypothetical protein PR048_016057 [Dryococelus australis]